MTSFLNIVRTGGINRVESSVAFVMLGVCLGECQLSGDVWRNEAWHGRAWQRDLNEPPAHERYCMKKSCSTIMEERLAKAPGDQFVHKLEFKFFLATGGSRHLIDFSNWVAYCLL